MTKNSAFKLALAACLLGVGSLASAADTYNGVQLHAVGNAPAFNTFNPESNPGTRMYDDGATAGDVTADDNIWTVSHTFTPAGAPAWIGWKMGSWDGTPGGATWGVQSGYDGLYDVNVSPTTFYFVDPNAAPDGWLPANDYTYTDNDWTAYVGAASAVYLVGTVQGALGAGSEWDLADQSVALTDDGTDPNDTAADGIYTLTMSGLPQGNTAFKIMLDLGSGGAYADGQAHTANPGGQQTGGNITVFLTAGEAANPVVFEWDTSTLRYRFTKLAPPPPAGTWAFGPWGNDFDSSTQMTSNADGFEGTFVVPTPGYYTAQVFVTDGSGGTLDYPAGGDNGYPFVTTVANQQVRVNFHTTAMADASFSPETNFLFTDPDSRLDFGVVDARVQFTEFLGVYGTALSSTATDWDIDPISAENAEATETAPGTEVFRLVAPTVTGFSGTPVSKNLKGVFDHPAIDPALTDGWHGQFANLSSNRKGGLTQGADAGTFGGGVPFDFQDGDEWTFVVDMATGRAGRHATSTPVLPLRPAAANVPVGGTNVQGWEMFE